MPKVLISCGEVSADQHAAELVNALRQKRTDLEFVAMGGKALKKAHVELLVNNQGMGMMGLSGLFVLAGRLIWAYLKLSRFLKKEQPCLMILLDYSGFNLRIAKVAKKANVKTLYYIAPQIWASRPGRLKTIKENIDHVAVLFPFEKPYYEKESIPVTFTGHPLANKVKPNLLPEVAIKGFRLSPQSPIIAILPGSRKGEMARLLPLFLSCAERLKQCHPNAQFILPLASNFNKDEIQPQLDQARVPVTVIQDQLYNCLQLCDLAIAASGTVTLEVALMEIPMVIAYAVDKLTYAIGKRLVTAEFMGLCNIIAGKKIVQEYMQAEATVDNLFAECQRILKDEPYRQQMKSALAEVKAQLSTQSADASITELALSLLPTAVPNPLLQQTAL